MPEMAEVTESEILAALAAVRDPDRDGDIVSLGMVSGVMIKGGHVVFSIEVDPQRGPNLEPLRKQAEETIHKLPGVLTVSAVLTAERAPASTLQAAKSHGHGHAHVPAAPAPLLPGVKHVIAVAAGKGGVGKSTTSVNLALALQRLGLRIGLYDADIFGPSQPRMLGVSHLQPTSNPDNKTLNPVEAHGLKVMSIGFMVPEDSAIIWRGAMVMGALEQLLRDVVWGELDVMIIDMPPGTGDTQLTISQKLPLAGAVIVSTPQDIALLDARKAINMFSKVNVPMLGIIENMSVYHCPNCGHEAHIFGHGGARAEGEKLGIEFLGALPLDIRIRTTGDEGTPIVMSEPESPLAQAYMALANKLWDKVSSGQVSKPAPAIVMQ
jgi:ATP-binding protein involved in chromosome partitioning